MLSFYISTLHKLILNAIQFKNLLALNCCGFECAAVLVGARDLICRIAWLLPVDEGDGSGKILSKPNSRSLFR